MEQDRVVVVGAGIMGLWSALLLREAGAEVVLVDAWGAGNSRATSADENRVIRCGYGGSRLYAEWSLRSLSIWERRGKAWGATLLHRCGVLWMAAGREAYLLRCEEDLRALRIPHEHMTSRAMTARWPVIAGRGIRWALLEPESGALLARQSCLALRDAFLRAGGRIILGVVSAPQAAFGAGTRGRVASVLTATGEVIEGSQFLFACGPWLPSIFPRLLKRRINVTRREVLYFGTPQGDDSYDAGRFPVWMELGTDCYGIPALDGKGFKMHPDHVGPKTDPTTMDRRPTAPYLKMARACLARRFPGLADSPVIETRVCQYEATPDDQLLFDRHPDLENVWILGGGSGHCFKHGPVIGEMAAEIIMHRTHDKIPAPFRLSHQPGGRNF